MSAKRCSSPTKGVPSGDGRVVAGASAATKRRHPPAATQRVPQTSNAIAGVHRARQQSPSPAAKLARALRAIGRIAGTQLLRGSPNYLSTPLDSPDIDGVPAPDYVNAVVQVATALPPRALLRQLQRIERRQGRIRGASGPRNLPRTLDLDLLLFDDRRMRTTELSLPHPRMHQRAFVLRPLSDVAPHATIPGRDWRDSGSLAS